MNNTNKTHLLIERMCAKINDGRTITADDVAEMLDTIRAWRDLSDARVAAAYEAASDRVLANRAHLNFEAMLSLLRDTPLPEPVVVAVSNLLDGIAEAIRNLTPADEATALDRMIAEAVAAEREACAEIVEHNSEFVRSTDNSRHLQPRSEGDRMALGYANAIRARGEGREDG